MWVVGYDVVGCTVTSDPSTSVIPNPFMKKLPFPHLDPRAGSSSQPYDQGHGHGHEHGEARKGDSRRMVQVTRFHIRLDDQKTHCFVRPLSLSSLFPLSFLSLSSSLLYPPSPDYWHASPYISYPYLGNKTARNTIKPELTGLGRFQHEPTKRLRYPLSSPHV